MAGRGSSSRGLSEVSRVDEVEEERQKRMDERFARDKERLDKVEVTTEDLKQIVVRLDVVIEDQRKQLANHEQRLVEMESKPARRWEAVINTVLQWLAVAIMAAVVVFK
ncbi:MAG TPA: hypothetical protein VHO71_04800 [Caproiciproducens sp.]|nr:hypothetical protein [Caproiciproducens sp.]